MTRSKTLCLGSDSPFTSQTPSSKLKRCMVRASQISNVTGPTLLAAQQSPRAVIPETPVYSFQFDLGSPPVFQEWRATVDEHDRMVWSWQHDDEQLSDVMHHTLIGDTTVSSTALCREDFEWSLKFSSTDGRRSIRDTSLPRQL